MDRRLFKAVHLNAKRMGEARAARCSPEEIEAIRQAGREQVEKVRALIDAGIPDDGNRHELARWEAETRRQNNPFSIDERYWNSLSNRRITPATSDAWDAC